MVILGNIFLKIVQMMKLRETAVKLNSFDKSWRYGTIRVFYKKRNSNNGILYSAFYLFHILFVYFLKLFVSIFLSL